VELYGSKWFRIMTDGPKSHDLINMHQKNKYNVKIQIKKSTWLSTIETSATPIFQNKGPKITSPGPESSSI